MTKETKDSLDYNLRMFDHHRNQSEGRKSWEITIKVQISKKSHDIGVLVLLEPNLEVAQRRHACLLVHNSEPVSYPANPRPSAQRCSHRRRDELARRHYPMDPYNPPSGGLGCYFSHRDGARYNKK